MPESNANFAQKTADNSAGPLIQQALTLSPDRAKRARNRTPGGPREKQAGP